MWNIVSIFHLIFVISIYRGLMSFRQNIATLVVTFNIIALAKFNDGVCRGEGVSSLFCTVSVINYILKRIQSTIPRMRRVCSGRSFVGQMHRFVGSLRKRSCARIN